VKTNIHIKDKGRREAIQERLLAKLSVLESRKREKGGGNIVPRIRLKHLNLINPSVEKEKIENTEETGEDP